MAAKTKTRRIKRVPLTQTALNSVFSGSPHRMLVKGFPKDAKFLGANFDADRSCFMCLYEHESFAEVHWGQVIPIFDEVFVASSAKDLKRLLG